MATFCSRCDINKLLFLVIFADACTHIRSALSVMTLWLKTDENYAAYVKNDLAELEKLKEEKMKVSARVDIKDFKTERERERKREDEGKRGERELEGEKKEEVIDGARLAERERGGRAGVGGIHGTHQTFGINKNLLSFFVVASTMISVGCITLWERYCSKATCVLFRILLRYLTETLVLEFPPIFSVGCARSRLKCITRTSFSLLWKSQTSLFDALCDTKHEF